MAGKSINWRKTFFYGAEIVFACIAGTGEAAIYYAYTPPGPWRWLEAVARAFITQVAIIFFGIAAVQAYESARKGWQGFLAAMPANIATGVFSLVAFWFIRDAAIVYRDASVLGPAENVTYTLPWNGYTLTGQTIDVYLIAALPLFQVGLNWLSPLITREKTAQYETEEQRRLREENELADARHQAEMARVKAQQKALNAAGWRGAGLALMGRENPLEEPPHDDASSQGESSASAGDIAVDLPDQNTQNSGGKSRGSGRTKQGQTGLHTVPTGMWTATDLQQYIERVYGATLDDERAVQVMATMPQSQRLKGVRGNPYGAPKAIVRRWADQTYKVEQNDAVLPQQNTSTMERSA